VLRTNEAMRGNGSFGSLMAVNSFPKRRLATLLVSAAAAYLPACPQAIRTVADAGNASDGGNNKPDAATDSGSTNQDSGSSVDSGPSNTDSGTDGGSTFQGDGGPFTWTQVQAPVHKLFTGISGSSYGVYACAGDGAVVYGSAATTFLDVLPACTVGTLYGIWTSPSGGVYAAGQQTLVACTCACVQSANYVTTTPPTPTELRAVCGKSDTEVYVVGYDSSTGDGVLWMFNGGGWVELNSNIGLVTPFACYLDPGGVLYIAGQENVGRYDTSTGNGNVTIEQVN
jgi:hypothetical protein